MMLLYYANTFPTDIADIILYSATTRDHVGDSTLHTQIGSKLHSTSQSAHSTDHSSNSTRNSDSSENASNTTTESNDVFILTAVGAGSGGLVVLGTILTPIVLCLWKCWQAKHRGMHVCVIYGSLIFCFQTQNTLFKEEPGSNSQAATVKQVAESLKEMYCIVLQ